MSKQTSNALVISTHDQARAAVGKLVRVHGKLHREKLGDTINVGDLWVMCEDFRFPGDSVGKDVTAEGTLGVSRDEPDDSSSADEVSQGTNDGSSWLVLTNCVAR